MTTLPSKTNTTANIGVYSAHIKRFILKMVNMQFSGLNEIQSQLTAYIQAKLRVRLRFRVRIRVRVN